MIENRVLRKYVGEYCYDYKLYYENLEEKFIVIADIYGDGRSLPFTLIEKDGEVYNDRGEILGKEDE